MKIDEFEFVMLFAIMISGLISFFLLKRAKKEFLDITKKSHAIHKTPVPRIGGISIFLSFLLSWFYIKNSLFVKLLLPASLAFGIGLVEDLKKNISPKLRLFFVFLASVIAMVLLDLKIDDVGFLKLPTIVSIPLTLIAIAGFTNAMNIIDGLNGLASGIAVTFLLFLGLTYYEYGFHDFSIICFATIGGILGFLIFNFPTGKIFLGDGGAYFLGFLCAVLSVKLFNLVPEISPWFPFMLGVYPVWEVLFSAYRRKKKGKHPFNPDRLHFHTLVYYRLTHSNPKASILIVAANFIFSLVAFLMRTCTFCLVAEFFVFVMMYLVVYRRLVRIMPMK